MIKYNKFWNVFIPLFRRRQFFTFILYIISYHHNSPLSFLPISLPTTFTFCIPLISSFIIVRATFCSLFSFFFKSLLRFHRFKLSFPFLSHLYLFFHCVILFCFFTFLFHISFRLVICLLFNFSIIISLFLFDILISIIILHSNLHHKAYGS